MGRPTDCTPETIKIITDAVRLGATYRIACAAAGVGVSTFGYWKQRGELGEEPYAGFLAALTRAEAEHATKLLGVLDGLAVAAKDERVQADSAKFVLSTRYHKEYGRSIQEVEHTGTIQTVKVEFGEGATIEQLRAMAGKQSE